jgi:exonuclease V
MTNGRRADLLDFDHDHGAGTNTALSKNAMERLHKNVIRATDISAQFWCEKQMELGYLYGKKETFEMRSGSAAHKEIESILNIPVNLKPESYADSFYKGLYTSYLAVHTLPERGVAREINIYGSANGFKIAGKIDEIKLEDGSIAVYEDKTKTSDKEPTEAQILSHSMQVELYIKMMNDIKSGAYTFENFAKSYHIADMDLTPDFVRQLDSTPGISEEAKGIEGIARLYFSSIRESGQTISKAYLRYINSVTGNIIKTYSIDYDEKAFMEKLRYALEYWSGAREAKPVEEKEKWKCNYCQFFGKQCTVWYEKKQKVL